MTGQAATTEPILEITTPPMYPVRPEHAVYIRVVDIVRVGNSIIARLVCGHSFRLLAYIPIPLLYAPQCIPCAIGAPTEPWYRAH